MLFNSFSFLIFFPIVLAGYFCIPRKCREIWLLAASYYFYMSWNVRYTLLLASSTLITYLAALLLRGMAGERRRRLTLAAALLVNFGMLFGFKYLDFFLETLEKLLRAVGISIAAPRLDLLLPVGISFYIFQAASYLLDVYRGSLEPERNLLRYALFVSFFPQLVAGPIERSGNLLPQLRELESRRLWDADRVQRGFLQMLYGYFLKLVIADRAAWYVDTIFSPADYDSYQGVTVLLAAVLFSVQIYCDFAGYSAIAIGAARILGIELMENFHMPYLATGIRDFWNRWHISLSTWFRDYLYIPLGGGRRGRVRKYGNLMVVFLVSGLWHGAALHYIVWGGIHGVLRILEEATDFLRAKVRGALRVQEDAAAYRCLQRIATFLLVTAAWMFFRADSARMAWEMLRSIFAGVQLWVVTDGMLFVHGIDHMDANCLIAAVAVMAAIDRRRERGTDVLDAIMRQGVWFRWILYYAAIFCILIFGVYGKAYESAAFLYFQF